MRRMASLLTLALVLAPILSVTWGSGRLLHVGTVCLRFLLL